MKKETTQKLTKKDIIENTLLIIGFVGVLLFLFIGTWFWFDESPDGSDLTFVSHDFSSTMLIVSFILLLELIYCLLLIINRQKKGETLVEHALQLKLGAAILALVLILGWTPAIYYVIIGITSEAGIIILSLIAFITINILLAWLVERTRRKK